MLEWILANKQWLFSGIGVTAIVAVVAIVRRARWPVRKTAAEVTSLRPGFVAQRLTPGGVMSEFSKAPPLQRVDVAKHYKGVAVDWEGRLHDAQFQSGRRVWLQLTAGLTSMFVECNDEDHPGLSLLKTGAPVRVVGTIEDVTQYGIAIAPSRLEF